MSRRREDGTKAARGALIGALLDAVVVGFAAYVSGGALTNLN